MSRSRRWAWGGVVLGLLARLGGGGARAAVTADQIDTALEAAWSARKLTGSPPAGDDVFLRRLSLDLLGTGPSGEMIEDFLADPAGDRRDRIVERFLATGLFDRRWAEVYRRLLLGRQPDERPAMRAALDHWLADRISRGVGLDRIAREIITAEGSPMDNPAVTVLLRFEDSREGMAGHLARSLLGVKIMCAQCHDHPFEKWTRKDFYGFTAFFGRTRRTMIPTAAYEKLRTGAISSARELLAMLPEGRGRRIPDGHPRLRETQEVLDRLRRIREANRKDPQGWRGADTVEDAAAAIGMGAMMGRAGKAKPPALPVLVEAPVGEVEIPDPDRPGPVEDPRRRRRWDDPVPPRFLDGTAPPFPDPGVHRRQLLADWMVSPENPWFARAMVNRVWFQLMGRGLVEPVDDVSNPEDDRHAELLEALAGHFVEQSHDLRGLIRLIVSTRAYQRSSEPNATNVEDVDLYSRRRIRPLDPEQVFASIVTATGIVKALRGPERSRFEEMKQALVGQFVHRFQVDEAGDRLDFQENVNRALFLMNSQVYNRPLAPLPGTTLHQAMQELDPREQARILTQAVYGREPRPDEIARIRDHLEQAGASGDGTTPASPEAGRPGPRAGARGGDWIRRAIQRVRQGRSGRGPGASGAGPAGARVQAFQDILWAMLASTEFLVIP